MCMEEHMEARGLHHAFSNTLQLICLKQGLSLNLELTNLPILPYQQAVGSPHFCISHSATSALYIV